MFDNHKDAVAAGWHSRRHETNEAHMRSRKTARERRQERQERALVRQEDRAQRTPKEQLDILEARGVTKGREVERLKNLLR